MATSQRKAPRGSIAPKTWSSDPEDHRRLIAEASISNFSRVGTLEDLVAVAVPSGIGQLYLLAATAAFPNLTSAAWVPVTQYDATIPATAADARGVTLDTTAGTIAFKNPGIWRVDFSFSMTHDENNAGRTLELRLFDTTDAVGGRIISVAIGRNQPGTSYAVSFLADIPLADINHPFRVELKMATGSAGLNTITFTALTYFATYAGTFEELVT